MTVSFTLGECAYSDHSKCVSLLPVYKHPYIKLTTSEVDHVTEEISPFISVHSNGRPFSDPDGSFLYCYVKLLVLKTDIILIIFFGGGGLQS